LPRGCLPGGRYPTLICRRHPKKTSDSSVARRRDV
jgi:hypothetical protein